jgi:protoporphyrinogen oxidase
VEQLLGGRLRSFEKTNRIWQAGHVIDYPYQFNAHQLPDAIRNDCRDSFPRYSPESSGTHGSFHDWLLAQFGEGFYRHFFGPYNEKLYGTSPSELEAAPMVWTIPADDRERVLHGIETGRSPSARSVVCSYPVGRDGIAAVTQAVERTGSGDILVNQEVEQIDPVARCVRTRSGLEVRYETLVSSLPLPRLVERIVGAAPEVMDAAARLRTAAVTVVQIGSRRRTEVLDVHWTYFPDANIPFYRMTRLERISPDLCPPGGSALLLECPGDRPPDRGRIVDVLVQIGVLPSSSIEHFDSVVIPHAYVLFLHGYRRDLSTIRSYLGAVGIRTVGRYGEWEYTNIEQAMQSGIRCATDILAGGGGA